MTVELKPFNTYEITVDPIGEKLKIRFELAFVEGCDVGFKFSCCFNGNESWFYLKPRDLALYHFCEIEEGDED